MEHHLDHKVVLDTDSRHKGLYDWSLQEVDDEGKQVGRDQIPWGWTLYFTLTEIGLTDTLTMERPYTRDSEPAAITVRDRRIIRAKLRPGDPHDMRRNRCTTYSMFGTNRSISDFELFIEKLQGEDDQERCEAWGGVSYTSEVDFREETVEDSVSFHLHVRPQTFDRYIEAIRSSTIDEAFLRVKGVEGFYSEWSPAISTDKVKVLTSYEKEHRVTKPEGCELNPPRLGKVGEAELITRRVRKLDASKLDKADEEPRSGQQDVAVKQAHVPPYVDTNARTFGLLSSLRLGIWVVAALLVLLLLK